MTREETREVIYKIFNFIDGTNELDERWGGTYGHPALYFFHSKEELDKQVEAFLNSKDTFDRYDVYYFCNKMIKFLLGKTDSHTKVNIDSKKLPILFKVINDKLYIINITKEFSDALYGELISINGVSVETIEKYLEEITSYSTIEFLQNVFESSVINPNVLRSLPCFDKDFNKLTYSVLQGDEINDFTFDLNHLDKYPMYDKKLEENYTYKIEEDTLVLVYNACKDKDKMDKFVEEIKDVSDKNHINKFIVDLRGNGGGDSEIINPLIEFLKDKKVVTLIDEKVFSSGRIACIKLHHIGSYFIGTNIATSLSAFGNNPNNLELKDLGLRVNRSTKYFKYDENFRCRSFNKLNFIDYFESVEHFNSFDPLIFKPDKYVYRSLDDYKYGTDLQLDAALKFLSKEKENKR